MKRVGFFFFFFHTELICFSWFWQSGGFRIRLEMFVNVKVVSNRNMLYLMTPVWGAESGLFNLAHQQPLLASDI